VIKELVELLKQGKIRITLSEECLRIHGIEFYICSYIYMYIIIIYGIGGDQFFLLEYKSIKLGNFALVIQFTMQVSAMPLFAHVCYDPIQIVRCL
jgi:hypothetical protein